MCASRQAIIEHYKYDANLLLFDTVDPNLYQDVEKYSQDTCLVFDTDYIYKKKTCMNKINARCDIAKSSALILKINGVNKIN